jgi:hypothetical protein
VYTEERKQAMETKLILIHNSFLLVHLATYANTVTTNTSRLQDATDTDERPIQLIQMKDHFLPNLE